MKNVKVTIHKPLYGNYVNIRDKFLKEAYVKGVKLEITIPNGTAVVDPKWWIQTGKKVEQVFLRPDEPMILWGNTVPVEIKVPPRVKEDKKIINPQASLF